MQSKKHIEKCPKIRFKTTNTFLDYRIKVLMLNNNKGGMLIAIQENYLTKNLAQSEC